MAVNKITVNGRKLIDLSHDTVDQDSLLLNHSAHKKDGSSISGSAISYPGSDYYVDPNGILYRVTSDTSACRLRVMTFNVGDWYIGSHTRVPSEKVDTYLNIHRHIMETQSPDIAVFQEYWHYFDTNNTITAKSVLDPYFSDIKEEWPYDGYGHGMASKSYVLEDYKHYRFDAWASTVWDYGFERAYIHINGKRICIINTWVEAGDLYFDERASQLNQILEYVASEPYFIIMGDFNIDCPDGPTGVYYNTYIKPFVDAGHTVCNNAVLDGTFRHYLTYYRLDGTSEALDQIITSSNITVANIFIDRTKLDDLVDDKVDHVPFLADLIIN